MLRRRAVTSSLREPEATLARGGGAQGVAPAHRTAILMARSATRLAASPSWGPS